MTGWSSGARRALLALLGTASFAVAASAQSSNPFAFLFGGSPREGRSAYAPAPVPAPFYGYGYRARPYGYSSPPGYSDPYATNPDGEDGPRSTEPTARYGPSPQEVLAAIKAVKRGKGPLGPFVNDPTLRSGDVVVTTKGLMVYRGGAGGPPHRESDFVSISNASGLVANKQTLISLEKASRLTPHKPLGVETKQARKRAPEIASSATPRAAR